MQCNLRPPAPVSRSGLFLANFEIRTAQCACAKTVISHLTGTLKMQDVKMTAQVTRHENEGYEIAEHENAGHEIVTYCHNCCY